MRTYVVSGIVRKAENKSVLASLQKLSREFEFMTNVVADDSRPYSAGAALVVSGISVSKHASLVIDELTG
jgi:hypothetical protein